MATAKKVVSEEAEKMAEKIGDCKAEPMNINQKLLAIQCELNAPKNKYNSFGKYYYRNTESIFEGIKPLLKKYRVTLTMNDEVSHIEGRFYVVSHAMLTDVDSGDTIIRTGFAREDESKKGMDGSQVTGATISYARKYALGALLIIDDTEDSDSDTMQAATNYAVSEEVKAAENPQNQVEIQSLKEELLGICQKNNLDAARTAKALKLKGDSTKDQIVLAIETLNQWIDTNQDLHLLKKG